MLISMKAILFTVILISLGLFSCKKSGEPGGIPDGYRLVLLQSWLRDGPWQLVSSTKVNFNTGTTTRYTGQPTDSIAFLYDFDAYVNVVETKMYSVIGGVYNECGYKLLPPIKDTAVVCFPYWKPGYLDTIRIKSFSEESLVLQVKINDSSFTGYEIDTLKKLAFWH